MLLSTNFEFLQAIIVRGLWIGLFQCIHRLRRYKYNILSMLSYVTKLFNIFTSRLSLLAFRKMYVRFMTPNHHSHRLGNKLKPLVSIYQIYVTHFRPSWFSCTLNVAPLTNKQTNYVSNYYVPLSVLEAWRRSDTLNFLLFIEPLIHYGAVTKSFRWATLIHSALFHPLSFPVILI
jgi:hypothetical protein